MSNPYYTESFLGQAGQTARAQHVKSQLDAIQVGFDLVYAGIGTATQLINRTIRAPTGETLNELPAAAVRKNTYLSFDSLGQPVTGTVLPTSALTVVFKAAALVTFNANKATRYVISADNNTAVLPLATTCTLGDVIYFSNGAPINGFSVTREDGINLQGLNEDLTVDVADFSFGLIYATDGWRLI